MKNFTLAAIAVLLLVASGNAQKKSSSKKMDQGTSSNGWVAVDSATAMQKYMEAAAVGEEHKGLASSEGSWTGKATMWMGKGAPPIMSDMKMDVKMLLGGRYQESTYSGDMGGMPFSGVATIGYDNYKKKYFSTSVDNMGTGMIYMEGWYDPATKTYTFDGDYPNPANGVTCHLKQVYKIVDADTEIMEMWGPDQTTGEMYKTMVINFTRTK
ncbi:MAG: DUF1579 domain-containing protein [Chitinophagaceae bacterium]|nr:MAG: DUF1579 domain-containing protein [Chitinophagaceae bacterium]